VSPETTIKTKTPSVPGKKLKPALPETNLAK